MQNGLSLAKMGSSDRQCQQHPLAENAKACRLSSFDRQDAKGRTRIGSAGSENLFLGDLRDLSKP